MQAKRLGIAIIVLKVFTARTLTMRLPQAMTITTFLAWAVMMFLSAQPGVTVSMAGPVMIVS